MTCPLLFVYGTLLRDSPHPMARFLETRSRFLGEATVRGRLYDLGDYPGMLEPLNSEDWVRGELIELNEPEKTMLELDRYEGCFPEHPQPYVFERKLEEIVGSEGIVPGWVYWFRGKADEERRIGSGDYREVLKLPGRSKLQR